MDAISSVVDTISSVLGYSTEKENSSGDPTETNSSTSNTEKEDETAKEIAEARLEGLSEKVKQSAKTIVTNAQKTSAGENTTQAVAQKKPPLNLQRISLKELEKKNSALVKKHCRKNTKDIKWDQARNVAVFEKSGKYRVYPVGDGSSEGIVLFEDKSWNKAVEFLNKI